MPLQWHITNVPTLTSPPCPEAFLWALLDLDSGPDTASDTYLQRQWKWGDFGFLGHVYSMRVRVYPSGDANELGASFDLIIDGIPTYTCTPSFLPINNNQIIFPTIFTYIPTGVQYDATLITFLELNVVGW